MPEHFISLNKAFGEHTCIFSSMISFYNGRLVTALWFQVSLSFHSLAFRNVSFAWQMIALVLAVKGLSVVGRYAERDLHLRPVEHNSYLLGECLLDFSLCLWGRGPESIGSYCSCGNKQKAKFLLLWVKSAFILIIQQMLLLYKWNRLFVKNLKWVSDDTS